MSMIKQVLSELDQPTENTGSDNAAYEHISSYYDESNYKLPFGRIVIASSIAIILTSSLLTFAVIKHTNHTLLPVNATKTDRPKHKNTAMVKSQHHDKVTAIHSSRLHVKTIMTTPTETKKRKTQPTRLKTPNLAIHQSQSKQTKMQPIKQKPHSLYAIPSPAPKKTLTEKFSNKSHTTVTHAAMNLLPTTHNENKTSPVSSLPAIASIKTIHHQPTTQAHTQLQVQPQTQPKAIYHNSIQVETNKQSYLVYNKIINKIKYNTNTENIQQTINQATSANLNENQLFQIASFLIKKNKVNEASTFLSQTKESHPQSILLAKLYARTLYKEGQYMQALSSLSDSTPAFYKHPGYYSLMASIYVKLNQPTLANQIYQHLIQNQPNEFQYWLGLAITYQRLNNIDEAISSYQHTLALIPLDSNIAKFSREQLYHLQRNG